jgi:hypothetical protein
MLSLPMPSVRASLNGEMATLNARLKRVNLSKVETVPGRCLKSSGIWKLTCTIWCLPSVKSTGGDPTTAMLCYQARNGILGIVTWKSKTGKLNRHLISEVILPGHTFTWIGRIPSMGLSVRRTGSSSKPGINKILLMHGNVKGAGESRRFREMKTLMSRRRALRLETDMF